MFPPCPGLNLRQIIVGESNGTAPLPLFMVTGGLGHRQPEATLLPGNYHVTVTDVEWLDVLASSTFTVGIQIPV